MSSLKKEEKRSITESQESVRSLIEQKNIEAEALILEGEIPMLYNNVALEEPDAGLLSEPLDFTVKDYCAEEERLSSDKSDTPNKLTHLPRSTFRAERSVPESELIDATGVEESRIDSMQDSAIHHSGRARIEPTISADLESQAESFTAIAQNKQEIVDDLAAEASQFTVSEEPSDPPKKRRGSQLGMGWFQGFSLFIFGLLFIGLAAFAYFMFGEESLYNGKETKYVVIPNEESGVMAALNPAISEEERKGYIYVPKEPRETVEMAEVEVPKLEGLEEQKFTQVEIVGHNDATGDDEISIETTVEESPALTLLSLDDTVGDLSQEDQALIDSYLLQADIAYTQGNYVGVDENDAYYYYRATLALDPENSAAQQGLLNIADIYYHSAYDAYNYDQLDIAEQYVAIGLVVQPNHSALYQLKSIIDQKRAESQFNTPTFNQGVQGFQFE